MVQAAAVVEDFEAPAGADPLFTLVETIEALSLARTVDQVAAVVRSAARRITGADGVAFVLRDVDQCWYLDEDAIGPLWKGLRFPMTACISGWAMLNKQTAIIPDIYADDRIPHDAYRPTFVKSLVMTPVRPADPIAAIGAYWSVERQPTQDEVVKLQIMARATAGALENAQMYASLTETLERRKFLLRELDHRCKNTLAAVQSIADQTLRKAASPATFVEAFNGRLSALSRAHELLTRQEWGRARLNDVLEQALSPFGEIDGARISLQGPAITLAPETSVSVHMTVHELAVNAAKHGALTTEDGRVEIMWSVDMAQEQRELLLEWRESGGPPVSMPTRAGFGMRLIEGGLARDLHGECAVDFAPEGLRFTLRVPLSPRIALA
ncbi:MAG: HWE histidine kinase domain-containing protein [Phenylobacterium sp.]|uniref:sensor histidine kinase n=1 Tax=Phenylobacterium sp. TaxID=1871053 RepID=UPI00273252E4|nr:HWE histidine kinase domain-containing protein [Phenylobacterium sp.]MDP3174219.1 HWE histidine kinase domain-containing protein [Phenylobacterium sp.]